MTNAEKIAKNYELKFYSRSKLLGIKKKGDNKITYVAPSKNVRLYFMFDQEFDKSTIQELISKRKAIKITGYDLYKLILEEKVFMDALENYKNRMKQGA